MKVKLSKNIEFLKCYNNEGVLLSDTGILEIDERNNVGILRIGAFKQILSMKKCKVLMELSGINVSRETNPIVYDVITNTVEKKENVEKQNISNEYKELESKSKEELIAMAKEIYEESQVDGRWGKPKLIEVILKAKE